MTNSKINSCKEDLNNIVEKYSLSVLLVSLHSLFVDIKSQRIAKKTYHSNNTIFTKQARALVVLEQDKWHLWQYLCEEEKAQNIEEISQQNIL
jgi:hypothetical protein